MNGLVAHHQTVNGRGDADRDDGISVVVPTRNRPHLLARCLASISASLRDGDELIVVDSGVPDASVDALLAECGGRLLRTHPGASYQRNAGAASASREIVAFVDDDVQVAPEWAGAVAGTMAAHPEISFVTGRLEVPDSQRGYGRPVSIKAESEAQPLTPGMGGTLGHSANMAVRRSAYLSVGGFDERLGPGARFRAAEDGDLIDRFFAAGHVGLYEPAVLGWHDQWRSRKELVRLEWAYGVGMGARMARLAHSDRTRAKAIAAEYLWRNALRPLPHHLVRHNEYAVLFALARVAGASWGFVGAVSSRFASRAPAALSSRP